MAQEERPSSRIPSCDAYFEAIQSKKKLPQSLQEFLTSALAQIPASSFPQIPGGKVIEIPADTSVVNAVRVLSENDIMAAPVVNVEAESSMDWKERYLGIIDYSAIIYWVLENAELAAVALTAGSATAAGVGAGALGALGVGAVALGGATGPIAVAGLIFAAVGAAVAGGLAADEGAGKDAPAAADHLGEDFYKVLLQEEPFKSTTVESIAKSYRWAPFLPVALDSSMLTVLLLLSKYRLRNVPVIEAGNPRMRNFITQAGVVHGLRQCKGSEWFDRVTAYPLSDFGLPFITYNEVISIGSNDLILEAFKRMKDNKIGGLPVLECNRKFVGSVSIRDIRFLLLRPRIFSNFRHLTVMDFLKTKQEANHGFGNMYAGPPVTCAPNACLGSVIESLASRSVHRVYVVEGGDDPEIVGVVTLRDVISCFINEPPGYFENYFGFAVKEALG